MLCIEHPCSTLFSSTISCALRVETESLSQSILKTVNKIHDLEQCQKFPTNVTFPCRAINKHLILSLYIYMVLCNLYSLKPLIFSKLIWNMFEKEFLFSFPQTPVSNPRRNIFINTSEREGSTAGPRYATVRFFTVDSPSKHSHCFRLCPSFNSADSRSM